MATDLSCDLGEGFGPWRMGDDDALLGVVTSASVACGFHAGDPTIMRETCERAAALDVRVGAHVGYRDLVGFGRRRLDVSPRDLEAETLYQVGALAAAARAAGTTVRYVKPHGALYHAAASDPELARAITTAMALFDPDLQLLGPADSALETAALESGIGFAAEGFADRAYTAAGRLVPRSAPGAVLHAEAAIAQVVSIARTGTARTADGTEVVVAARSICVHGDTPDALVLARRIRAELTAAGVEIAPFS